MFDMVLNTPLEGTSRFDRSSSIVLLWKPSVFLVLPVIRNQSKTKTIQHTVSETFITTILDTKLKRFHGGFFKLDEILEIFARAFLIKIIFRTIYSGSFDCYKVFFWKIKKKNHQKDATHLKNNKNSSHNKRFIEKGGMKNEKYKESLTK